MKYWFFFIFIVTYIHGTIAQQVSWEVSSDKFGEVNNYLEVSFILSNCNGGNFRRPDFGGLKVVSGPAQSQRMQSINGVTEYTSAYTYVVTSSKAGNYTIGPATIQCDQQKLKTQPVSIQFKPISKESLKIINSKDNVIVSMETPKKQVFQGEQFPLDFVVYFKENISIGAITHQDNFEGFDVKEFEGNRVGVDSKNDRFGKFIVKRLYLTPLKSGSFSISPFDIEINYPVGRSLFGIQYNTKVLTSDKLNVTVLPLPTPTSSNFAGLVGTYTANATVNKTEITTDDALSYSLSLTGNGSKELLNAVKLDFGPAWEVGDPLISQNESIVKGNTLQHTVVIEYPLLPKSQGVSLLQPSITVFDTEVSAYVPLDVNAIQVEVTPSKTLSKPTPKGGDQVISLAPLMKNTIGGTFNIPNPFLSIPYIVALGCLFLFFLFMIFQRIRIDRSAEQKSAKPNADPLSELNKIVNEGIHNQLPQAMSLLNAGLRQRLGIDESAATEELLSKLSLSYDHDVAMKYNDIYKAYTAATYGGASHQDFSMIASNIRALLTVLDMER